MSYNTFTTHPLWYVDSTMSLMYSCTYTVQWLDSRQCHIAHLNTYTYTGLHYSCIQWVYCVVQSEQLTRVARGSWTTFRLPFLLRSFSPCSLGMVDYWKKGASGRGIAAKCVFSHTSQKAQSPLSPLQTAWTGFDPNLYSAGSSSASHALVENSNCKVFYTQQGHCDWHNVCHTPGARMVSSAFHSTKAVVSQVGALWTGLQDCGDWL